MKLIYEKPKGQRIKNQFREITTIDSCGYSYYTICENDEWLQGQWLNTEPEGKWANLSSQHCKSVRAFRRFLRKAPKGKTFILLSKFVGYHVSGVGKGED